MFNTDGGGSISTEEFRHLLETLGIKTSPTELENIIMEIDVDQSGEIGFSEFVSVMSRRVNPKYKENEIISAFKIFEDRERPGVVEINTLREALISYGNVNNTKAKELVKQLDYERSGEVRYKDFVKMMMS